MIKFLIKRLIKNSDNVKDPAVRRMYGTLCSSVGIGLNICLFAGKYLAGVLSGSVLHGENLVRAMLNGFKLGHREEAIPSARPLAAVALLLWTGAAAWWLVR